MKFQNPSIHHSKVNTHTDRQTDRQTQSDKPKAICPSNFFKVGGIKTPSFPLHCGDNQKVIAPHFNLAIPHRFSQVVVGGSGYK